MRSCHTKRPDSVESAAASGAGTLPRAKATASTAAAPIEVRLRLITRHGAARFPPGRNARLWRVMRDSESKSTADRGIVATVTTGRDVDPGSGSRTGLSYVRPIESGNEALDQTTSRRDEPTQV